LDFFLPLFHHGESIGDSEFVSGSSRKLPQSSMPRFPSLSESYSDDGSGNSTTSPGGDEVWQPGAK